MSLSTGSALPLTGIRVVEFAGLAPGPMAGMILADFGADVIRVDRPTAVSPPTPDVLGRGKRSIAIDPKTRSGYEVVRKLVERADVVIDPFRPGVMERLGLGPDVFLGKEGTNQRLIFARLVGFPRTGPHKNMAGHDLNYLALTGVLSMFPGEKKPAFPLNLLADFAGGGLTCATGVLLALMERYKSGKGQVVNTDMVTGVRYLSTFPLILSQLNTYTFGETRSTGLLDGGAPFYDVYTCADGRFMSVGCLEPHFFKEFLLRFLTQLPADFAVDEWRPTLEDQFDRDSWPRMRTFFERGFKMHPRDYWTSIFHETDACTVPVLSRKEAAALAAEIPNPSDNDLPVPHPSLSRTPSTSTSSEDASPFTSLDPGAHTESILLELGVGEGIRAALRKEGAILEKSIEATAKL